MKDFSMAVQTCIYVRNVMHRQAIMNPVVLFFLNTSHAPMPHTIGIIIKIIMTENLIIALLPKIARMLLDCSPSFPSVILFPYMTARVA